MNLSNKNITKTLIVSLFTIMGIVVCAMILPTQSPIASSSNYVKQLENTYGVGIDLIDELHLNLPKNSETLPVNDQVKILSQGFFDDRFPDEGRPSYRTRGGPVIYATVVLYKGELLLLDCNSNESTTDLPCPEVKRIN